MSTSSLSTTLQNNFQETVEFSIHFWNAYLYLHRKWNSLCINLFINLCSSVNKHIITETPFSWNQIIEACRCVLYIEEITIASQQMQYLQVIQRLLPKREARLEQIFTSNYRKNTSKGRSTQFLSSWLLTIHVLR